MDCCIKKYPLSPLENCAAASTADVNRVLRDIAAASTVSIAATINDEEEFNPDDFVDPGEFANNEELPEWKQRCIKFYVACTDGRWTGNCYDCIRYCEGQRKWPKKKCHPPGEGP